MSNETLILGLGNPLRGDDGFGPAVIAWLQDHGLPPGLVAVDGGTAGLELVLTLMSYRRALIVDAADIGRAPGEWIHFTPGSQPGSSQVVGQLEEKGPLMSMHAAGLAEALTLGTALGVLPGEVVIFGVQPAQLDWSPGLSAEVEAAVPVVGREILRYAQNDDTTSP